MLIDCSIAMSMYILFGYLLLLLSKAWIDIANIAATTAFRGLNILRNCQRTSYSDSFYFECR